MQKPQAEALGETFQMNAGSAVAQESSLAEPTAATQDPLTIGNLDQMVAAPAEAQPVVESEPCFKQTLTTVNAPILDAEKPQVEADTSNHEPLQARNPNCEEEAKQALINSQAAPGTFNSPAAPMIQADDQVAPLQPPPTSGTPTAHGLLSPRRPVSATLPFACMSPPGSAAKHQEAAMTLAWLAEACTGVAACASPQPLLRAASTPYATQYTARPNTGSERVRRASSLRFDPVTLAHGQDEWVEHYEDDGEEAPLVDAPTEIRKARKATLSAARAARRAHRAVGANGADTQTKSKPRNHSQHSRVGRAMTSIIGYILNKQDEYLGDGNGGVPERVIRQEYGNNPDTSKALRLLVGDKKIVRCGAGGRKDPFSYTLAPGYVPTADESATAATVGPTPIASKKQQQQKASPSNAALATKTPATTTGMVSPPHTAATIAALNVPSAAKRTPGTAIQQVRGAARRKQGQPRLSLVLEPIIDPSTAAAGPSTTGTSRQASGDDAKALIVDGKRARKPSIKAEEAKDVDFWMADRKYNITTYQSVGQKRGADDDMHHDAKRQASLAAAQFITGTTTAATPQLPSIPTLQTPSMPHAAQQMMAAINRPATVINPQQAAYMLQMQAVQMYWRQQMAMEAVQKQQAGAAIGGQASHATNTVATTAQQQPTPFALVGDHQ